MQTVGRSMFICEEVWNVSTTCQHSITPSFALAKEGARRVLLVQKSAPSGQLDNSDFCQDVGERGYEGL
jgi:hypothetical protein